ncbi:MAG: ArnT family glycosyltransferase [Planctomycetota bacterium]
MSGRRVLTFAAPILILSALTAVWIGFQYRSIPGWDESYHGVTALRYAHYIKNFEFKNFFEALTFPDAYPPLGHAGMSLGFLVFGSDYHSPRIMTAIAWALSIFLASRVSARIVDSTASGVAQCMTALFGVLCGIGVMSANAAMLEPWSALATIVSITFFARAVERPRLITFLLFGLSLSAGLFVKYNHGPVPIVAIPCLFIWEKILRFVPRAEVKESVSWRLAAAAFAGLAAPLAWWYLYPWPGGGAELAEAHRNVTKNFFTSPTAQAGFGIAGLIAYFPFACCHSLVSCIIQLSSIVYFTFSRTNSIARFCCLVAAGSILAVLIYPHREYRFFLPGLVALWPLAGAMTAKAIVHIYNRNRGTGVLAALGLAIVIIATGGAGAVQLYQLFRAGPVDERSLANTRNTVAAWTVSYPLLRGRAAEPDARQQILDAAAKHLDPVQPFAWVGGTTNDFSRALVRWRLYQLSDRIECLDRETAIENHLLFDPGWNELGFRRWVLGFPQVVTIFPPDLEFKQSTEYERLFVKWMPRVTDFQMKAQESFPIKPDGVRLISIFVKK